MPTNPIRAFLSATLPLRGCDLSDDDAYHHGRDLVAIMAAQLEQVDDPTLPLSVRDCADVLEFLVDRQAIVDADVAWTAGSPLPDEHTAKYGGDPGHGVFKIIRHVADQLRERGANDLG